MGLRIPIRLTAVEQEVLRQHGRARDLSIDERNTLDTFAEMMVTDIEEVWPVDTGLSRDAWSWVLEIRPGDYSIVLLNDVDYAEFVHEAGAPPDPPLYAILVPRVLAAYRDRLIASMQAMIRRTEQRLQPGQQPSSLKATPRQDLIQTILQSLGVQ